jgi:carboxyl-terminal processing protease
MRLWRRTATWLILAAALTGGVGLAQALNGCSAENQTLGQMAEVIGVDPFPLSPGGSRELGRFNAVFTTYAADDTNGRELKHFRDAFKRVHGSYVREVSERELVEAAIAGVLKDDPKPGSMSAKDVVEAGLDAMTASLDPHSAYLNAQELQEAELVTSGEFGGLGIQVTQQDDDIRVISPIEGTPADRAGLKAGDLITHLDGKPVAGMSLTEAVQAMRGEPGSRIALTIRRGDQPAFTVAVTRAVIKIEPVRWRVEDNVGYIRIVSFNEKTKEALDAALRELRGRLGPGSRGLVVDLRNNPGGLFDQSVGVADAFLDRGIIVSVRGRDSDSGRSFEASKGDLGETGPVVVLINAGSASASEIVAAALQDQGRATVLGTRSFGKGSVQTLIRLPVEGAVKLTTALYYAPGGEAIQALGVTPDIILTGVDEGADQAHEADLPGALPAQAADQRAAQATLDVANCPAIGEEKDRELGCAIAFLRAGSTDRFLASLGVRSRL